MCNLFGLGSAATLGILYAAGVVTVPALKMGWAKIKAWIQAHK